MDTSMPSSYFISPADLSNLVGRPGAPLLLDVRRDLRFDESDRMMPGARRCAPEGVARFAAEQSPRDVVVHCVHGLEIGEQAACELRARGWNARFLQGGIEGFIDEGLPTLRKRPDLGVTGLAPSRWITRSRPKIDRIACPWLIARFIDPNAEFHYVPAAEVFEQAKRLRAVPYDIADAPITHEGAQCSFDALLKAFDLRDSTLDALATIVRGADTDRLELAPQSAGLLAISLGLSLLHTDDHEMLAAALPVYDALYAWCRGAAGGRHAWQGACVAEARS
ncbi:MAG: chromate resistance protein ChrB domain-containing protein [Pseudomonadota bacterium]